jgi:hypothetical protein
MMGKSLSTPMKTIHFESLKCSLLSAMFMVVFVATASAQNFAINWSTIDGGGGASTGATYVVLGTIGQPDAGTMSGGNYGLSAGFWGLTAAVQTPGAPMLRIVSLAGGVRVSWPSPSSGFVLQQSSDINSGNWMSVPALPADDGSNKSVFITPAIGNLFLRLKK